MRIFFHWAQAGDMCSGKRTENRSIEKISEANYANLK